MEILQLFYNIVNRSYGSAIKVTKQRRKGWAKWKKSKPYCILKVRWMISWISQGHKRRNQKQRVSSANAAAYSPNLSSMSYKFKFSSQNLRHTHLKLQLLGNITRKSASFDVFPIGQFKRNGYVLGGFD